MSKIKNKVGLCITTGLMFASVASGIVLANNTQQHVATAASVPTGYYVKVATEEALEDRHWGTFGAGEKMTSDPLYEGISADGSFSMPIKDTGSIQYYAGKQGGYASYFNTHSQGYSYKFKMDFGDGDFTGCLYFGVKNKHVGIFDNQFARVNWAKNTVKSGTDMSVAYSKTYTGIQSVSISMEGVYAEETYTTPVGLVYSLTIGSDEYTLYFDDTTQENAKGDLANYTNEELTVYSWDYNPKDEDGRPLSSYVKAVEPVSLETEHWGTLGNQKVLSSEIYDGFSKNQPCVLQPQATGTQNNFMITAWNRLGGWKQYKTTDGFAYKFKMDFDDGDFNGCFYFGIDNYNVGIFDNKFARVGWANNTANTTEGAYKNYNKTYTGIQSVTIKYECVFSDAEYTTPVGKLFTLTIGTDTYKIYFDDTAVKTKYNALVNYTDEALTLYPASKDGMSGAIGTSISLDGDIALNFYVHLEDSVVKNENAKFVFTRANNETTEILIKNAEHEGYEYKFKIALPAKCVNEVVKGQVVVGENKGTEYSQSIKAYADYVLENSTNETLKTLVGEMLAYCEAAEAYFAGETVATIDANVEQSATTTITGNDENIAIAGATLVLEAQTSIRIYFNLKNDMAIDNVVCKIGGETVTPVLKNEETQLYYVEVSVAAKDLNTNYEISVGDYTLTYCAMTYVATVVNTNGVNMNLQNLVKALYNYSVAADGYFGA